MWYESCPICGTVRKIKPKFFGFEVQGHECKDNN